MVKYVPPGFDPARVIDGLHRAMGFGEPTRDADKATFWFVTRTAAEGAKDGDGVGFDPSPAGRAETSKRHLVVPCAIEYFDRADVQGTFGIAQPSRIEITLLDPDYQQIKGFSYVVAGGDKYLYRSTEPPTALGSVDIWMIHAVAEDES